MNLFSSEEKKIHLNLPNADLVYFPSFFSETKSTHYFNRLLSETNWKQDNITVYGKEHAQPRLTALYGLNEQVYTYSGLSMNPKEFTPLLLELKTAIETITHKQFNAVLLNLYRDGNDSVGWHSDDEKELGKNPTIASLSFGVERFFQLRDKATKKKRHNLLLEHGSVLLMQGETQHYWQHQIAKTKMIQTPRINLTFRII